jgi:hypothetical protein
VLLLPVILGNVAAGRRRLTKRSAGHSVRFENDKLLTPCGREGRSWPLLLKRYRCRVSRASLRAAPAYTAFGSDQAPLSF